MIDFRCFYVLSVLIFTNEIMEDDNIRKKLEIKQNEQRSKRNYCKRCYE